MNGTVIQKFLAVLKSKIILGKICFPEQIFYRKQSLGALAKCRQAHELLYFKVHLVQSLVTQGL